MEGCVPPRPLEGRLPPRPLARVEPGPRPNRNPWAGVEPGPSKAWRGGPIQPKPPVPPDGGTASTPSGAAGFSQGAAWVAVWAGVGARGRNECPRVPQKSGRLWEAGLGREPPGRSVAVGKRQQAGALQTLREFGGAIRGRGSAWTAAACRRCGRWARVERGPASSRCHRAGVEAGLPTGCYHHGWKQGHSFLELEEGRCPWEMVAQEAV